MPDGNAPRAVARPLDKRKRKEVFEIGYYNDIFFMSATTTISFLCCGTASLPNVKFLSENTLHTIDRLMWMLPFVTRTVRTDLETAAKEKGVSQETRTIMFLGVTSHYYHYYHFEVSITTITTHV